MSESFVIIWEKSHISLKLIDSSGVWSDSSPSLKTIEVSRPLRLSRIAHPRIQREIAASLSDLLENLDLNQPLWLLIPENWTTKIVVDSLDIPSSDIRHDQLVWEAVQRLSGDKSDYNYKIYEHDEFDTVDIRVIKSGLLESIDKLSSSIELDLAGISVIPPDGDSYALEIPYDLREYIPFESEDELPLAPHRSTISPVSAGLIVVVVAVVGWFWSRDSGKDIQEQEKLATTVINAEMTKPILPMADSLKLVTQTVLNDPIDLLRKNKTEIRPKNRVDTITKRGVQKTQPEISLSQSPLGIMQQSLPTGTVIELAVISPYDMRIEISGQINAKGWVKEIRKSAKLKQFKTIDKYKEVNKSISVFQLKKSGLAVDDGSRNIMGWRSKAIAAGLSVRGRSANGNSKDAFAFAESFWEDMNGFSKIYLAHDRNNWVVTVQ